MIMGAQISTKAIITIPCNCTECWEPPLVICIQVGFQALPPHPHPWRGLVFPSGLSFCHLCTGILSGMSVSTTFLCFSRSVWSLIFPTAGPLEWAHTLSGMNTISIRTGKVLYHIGVSPESLRMIQCFLLQQKLTQKPLGCLAQRWLACAKAPWAPWAWLRRWHSCLFPATCSSLPSLSLPAFIVHSRFAVSEHSWLPPSQWNVTLGLNTLHGAAII